MRFMQVYGARVLPGNPLDRPRQTALLFAAQLMFPFMLVGAAQAYLTGEPVRGHLFLFAAFTSPCVLIPAAWRNRPTTMIAVFGSVIAVVCSVSFLIDPSPVTLGGPIIVVMLLAISESARTTFVVGTATTLPLMCTAILFPKDRPMIGEDTATLCSYLMLEVVIGTAAAFVTRRAMHTLRGEANANELLRQQLLERTEQLESDVEARTADVAQRHDQLQAQHAALREALANQEALAARLHYLSYTDPLTGLPNRRAFLERLTSQLDDGGWLLIGDLDHFKQVNDTWGHPAGDTVLVGAARVLQETLGQRGFLARIGGEEFAAVIPSGCANGAVELAEQLCLSLRGCRWDLDDSWTQTLSLGVAAFGPQAAADPSMAMRVADEALYRAKANGRDRVEFAVPVVSG